MCVRGCFVMRVARDAGEDRVVAGVGMAITAGGPLALVRAGVDGKPRVIEAGPCPCRGVVAGGAGGGESRGDVVRIRSGLVFRLVTGEAVGWSAGVAAVDVATGAGNFGVRTRQRKRSVVVIERGRHPRAGVVADLAIRGEPGADVVRVGGLLEVGLVARDAGRAESGKHAAGVTTGAGQADVRAGERERGFGMIESRTRPAGGAVAHGAVCREARSHVVGVGGGLKVLAVA